jgi:signal transduction histidine kinase
VALFNRERAQLPNVRIDAVDVCVDQDQPALERALAGLLHNAAEANATAIDIYVRRDNDWVIVEVRDDGEGIRAEQLAKVCDAFYTSRRADGAIGLGLTLARVLAGEGGLSIDANEPRGTKVCMRLPVAQASELAADPAEA